MSDLCPSARSRRFEFGKNWRGFLTVVDDVRIAAAEDSLASMLGMKNLQGKSFLDVGSGSGLFSLAAVRLGATKVHSFDYDPRSVACAQELKTRYCPASSWTIEQGDVLDNKFVRALRQFDIVYSWGVLHHTGNMWRAFDSVGRLVGSGGRLFIAVYNKQVYWTAVASCMKRAYVAAPGPAKWLILSGYVALQVSKGLAKDLLLLRNPLQRYGGQARGRGMSWFHDCIDWVGGYPFETAKPEEVFHFFTERGFRLDRLITCGGGHGCNQFVFSATEPRSTYGFISEPASIAPDACIPVVLS